MNTPEFKNIAEAAAELTRKTTQNMTEVGIKTWKDIVSFNDTIAKAQTDMIKSYVPGYGYNEMAETFNKMQTEAIKTFATWANGFDVKK